MHRCTLHRRGLQGATHRAGPIGLSSALLNVKALGNFELYGRMSWPSLSGARNANASRIGRGFKAFMQAAARPQANKGGGGRAVTVPSAQPGIR